MLWIMVVVLALNGDHAIFGSKITFPTEEACKAAIPEAKEKLTHDLAEAGSPLEVEDFYCQPKAQDE